MATTYTLEDRRRYARWLAAPPFVRRSTGMPESKEAYSRAYGVTSRTLRRWDDDESVQAMVTEERANWETAPEGLSVEAPAVEPGSRQTQLERDYAEIREALVSAAKNGDGKSLDLFMRHYGGHLAAEEQAARKRGLAELDDDALVAETLELIGRERVEQWLVAV